MALPCTRLWHVNGTRHTQLCACPPKLGLYAVVPDAQWVDKAVQLGVPTVQLRFKSDDRRAVSQQIAQAVKAVAGTQSLLFINDHWQQAMDAGAYGVHLGQEDMQDAPLQALRLEGLRLRFKLPWLQRNVGGLRLATKLHGFRRSVPTTLKKMQTAPQGLGRLTQYVRLMQHTPLVAIGGIDLHSLPAVMQSGVGSVAVVRAITGAEDPAQAVHALMQCMA